MFLCCQCDTDHPGDDWQPGKCRCCGHRRFYWAPSREQITTARNAIRDAWDATKEVNRRDEVVTDRYEIPQLRKAPKGRRVLRERWHE